MERPSESQLPIDFPRHSPEEVLVEGFSSGAATIHLDVAESAGLGNEKPQID